MEELMPRYPISFDDGAMTFTHEDLPDVARAAQRVVEEAKAAGVWGKWCGSSWTTLRCEWPEAMT
jgi:hypothetical protein